MVEKNLIIDNIYISPYEKYAVLYAIHSLLYLIWKKISYLE